MKIITKLGVAFLLTLFATGVLLAQNPEANIASKMRAADNSVNVIGDRELTDAEIIAIGVPMSKDKINSLNIATQTTSLKGTDEIDIIGGTSQSFNAGPRTRGNVFYCTEEKILVEFMGWHDVTTDPTQMWMCIYEGDAAIGTYDLVSATDISPAPVGLGWVSSGIIDFPLVVGKYYMILASFQQACGYYCEPGITPFPYPVAFGEAIGGVGYAWTPQSTFPPEATLTPAAGAWDDPVLYHQQLVTEDPITDDNDVGILSIISPVSGSLLGEEDVTVTIKNYGANPQSGFDVAFTLDGGTAVVETVSSTINSGETLEYTFATTVDLSTIGVYELEACTDLTGDENPDNDCILESVEHIPPSYCDASTTYEDEYIANVLCGTIDNSSGWQGGVADYTAVSTAIGAGTMEEITVSSGTTYAADEVYAWVDWNNDYEFEIGGDEEFVFINDGTGSEYTSDIVVPASAPLGDHRMRIRMVYGSTPEPCENSAYGEIEDYTIEVVESTFGTLNGTITAEGGSAIEDATITVAGMTTTSGADGTYSFTDVFTGTQSVSCSADGYISETETVVIEEGQTVTLDFELVQAEFGNLEGTVTADGGSAMEGALISIAEMTVTSGADGFYSIMDVPVGNYTVSCTAAGYITDSESVIIENGLTATVDFDLIVIGLLPPTNLTADVVTGNDVELNWVPPGGVGYIQWDDGINASNGIGLNNGGVFRTASRWTPSELEPYAGNIMTSITFFPYNDANATYVLKAWVGDNAAIEILSQEVTSFNVSEFNEIALTSPIVIDDSKELWFGYEVSHAGGTNPAGVDAGPAVQGYGDMISTDGTTWIDMSATWGLDYNWNIAGYLIVPNDAKNFVNKPMVKTTISNPSSGDQLVASGENGEKVKMDKKADKSFLGYNVYQDGDLIAEEIENTNLAIFDLLPGTYSYDVKTVYDEGLSAGAGPVEATILEGVDRDLVIIEVATGTWCQYCPGSAMAVDEMHEEGLAVGVIEYHSGDAYETTESAARIAYYGMTGYPSAVFDGGDMHAGGSATQSLYSTYLPKYESRIEIPSLFEMEAEYINVSENNFQVSIEAEMITTYPLLTNDIVLQVALTESHIPESWQNQTELNFVLRNMIPDENSTELDFMESATQSVTLDFTIPSNYMMENLELVVYIQDITTKEVLQATMAWLITGIEEVIGENAIAVYPNPATDYVNITSDNNIKSITVYNNVGQVVFVENVENNIYKINTSDFETGIYYLHMDTDNGVVTKRIIVK